MLALRAALAEAVQGAVREQSEDGQCVHSCPVASLNAIGTK